MDGKIAVIVDVQNDFVKGGTLAYGFPSEDIVPHIVDRVAELKRDGYHMVATQDTHYSDYNGTLESKMVPYHCAYGSEGWRLVDGINELTPANRRFVKNTFGLSNLPQLLASCLGRDRMSEIRMLGGCASICLLANAVILRAFYPNTPIIVESRLCFDVDERSFTSAMKALANQNIVVE